MILHSNTVAQNLTKLTLGVLWKRVVVAIMYFYIEL